MPVHGHRSSLHPVQSSARLAIQVLFRLQDHFHVQHAQPDFIRAYLQLFVANALPDNSLARPQLFVSIALLAPGLLPCLRPAQIAMQVFGLPPLWLHLAPLVISAILGLGQQLVLDRA